MQRLALSQSCQALIGGSSLELRQNLRLPNRCKLARQMVPLALRWMERTGLFNLRRGNPQ
jgi:hypothetical protein